MAVKDMGDVRAVKASTCCISSVETSIAVCVRFRMARRGNQKLQGGGCELPCDIRLHGFHKSTPQQSTTPPISRTFSRRPCPRRPPRRAEAEGITQAGKAVARKGELGCGCPCRDRTPGEGSRGRPGQGGTRTQGTHDGNQVPQGQVFRWVRLALDRVVSSRTFPPERQKVVRKIKQAKRNLAAPDCERRGQLETTLATLRVDLNYILVWPIRFSFICCNANTSTSTTRK